MKKIRWLCHIVVLPCLAPLAAAQQPLPTWAFYFPDEVQPQITIDRDVPRRLEGSERVYTLAQVDDMRNSPDWFPDSHPPMPRVVAHGASGNVFACATCHLTSGMGHPESSSLVELTVDYMMRQVDDFRSGARSNPIVVDGEPQDNATQWMIRLAHELSDEDSRLAAEYVASLDPVPGWVQVVETDTVPRSYITRGYARLPWPEGGEEPIGNRIIELPKDVEREILRDPRSGTVAHVPVGAVERGRILATTGDDGHTIQCAICHGPELRGLGEIPGIAGRSPTYAFRQLYSFKDGSRSGPMATLMLGTVSQLTEEDMIALAAYAATLSY